MRQFLYIAALGISGFAAHANAATVAYEVSSKTAGNQSCPCILGMDFVVHSAIDVLSLGVFDDDSDGIVGTLVAEIWSRVGNTGDAKLATQTFSNSDPGTLVGGSRFKSIARLMLEPGDYSIVSYGYSADDRNANRGRTIVGGWTTNDGGGLISFVGSGRFGWDIGTSIGAVDTFNNKPADSYAAGTFLFEQTPSAQGAVAFSSAAVVPLPATLPLLLAALGALGLGARLRKRSA